MHIIATGQFNYQTTTNFDFERKVRDRTDNRNPQSTVQQGGEGDQFWMLTRFGVDFRYQKSTEVQIVLEQRTQLDGNTSDDRFNSNNVNSYTFSAGYNLKPHRFQLDVTYFRDRFNGADTGNANGAVLFRGQKQDAVLVMGSWSGRVGPLRGLVQGNVMLGYAKGAN